MIFHEPREHNEHVLRTRYIKGKPYDLKACTICGRVWFEPTPRVQKSKK